MRAMRSRAARSAPAWRKTWLKCPARVSDACASTMPADFLSGWLLDSGSRSLRSLGQNDTRTVQAKCFSYPSFELAQRDLPDHQHAGRAVVEAGNRRKILAAIFLERVRVLDRDLLQRFQTIGG